MLFEIVFNSLKEDEVRSHYCTKDYGCNKNVTTKREVTIKDIAEYCHINIAM